VEWTAFCTIVQNRDGNLNVPYLIENGGEVVVNWNWLDNDWNDNNPAARFANHFTSHPASWRGRVLRAVRSNRRASCQFRVKETFGLLILVYCGSTTS